MFTILTSGDLLSESVTFCGYSAKRNGIQCQIFKWVPNIDTFFHFVPVICGNTLTAYGLWCRAPCVAWRQNMHRESAVTTSVIKSDLLLCKQLSTKQASWSRILPYYYSCIYHFWILWTPVNTNIKCIYNENFYS